MTTAEQINAVDEEVLALEREALFLYERGEYVRAQAAQSEVEKKRRKLVRMEWEYESSR